MTALLKKWLSDAFPESEDKAPNVVVVDSINGELQDSEGEDAAFTNMLYSDNKLVSKWMDEHKEQIEAELRKLKHRRVKQKGVELAREDLDAWQEMIVETLAALKPEQRQKILTHIANGSK